MFKKGISAHILISEQIKDVEECLIQFESFLRAATVEETAPETLRVLAAGVVKCEDIIALACSCDRVANKCELASKRIVTRRVRFPKEFANDLIEIISLTKQEFALLSQGITMTFTQLNAFMKDHHLLDEIRMLESRVDVIEEKLYEAIYAMDMEPALQDRLAEMVELVCDSSDIIENIADQIQIILITRKA